jgi:adenylate kinase
MSKKLILLIGSPGSGKTTDAKYIAKKHQKEITSYSTGELIKEEILKETGIGKIAKYYVDSGLLVPSSIIIDVILTAIHNAPTPMVILDGFPRKVKQLNIFGDILFHTQNIDVVSIIEVKVNEETAKKRFLKTHGTEETFDRRLKSYNLFLDEIEERCKTYKKDIFHIVDGEQNLEDVVEEIDKLLHYYIAL